MICLYYSDRQWFPHQKLYTHIYVYNLRYLGYFSLSWFLAEKKLPSSIALDLTTLIATCKLRLVTKRRWRYRREKSNIQVRNEDGTSHVVKIFMGPPIPRVALMVGPLLSRFTPTLPLKSSVHPSHDPFFHLRTIERWFQQPLFLAIYLTKVVGVVGCAVGRIFYGYKA